MKESEASKSRMHQAESEAALLKQRVNELRQSLQSKRVPEDSDKAKSRLEREMNEVTVCPGVYLCVVMSLTKACRNS